MTFYQELQLSSTGSKQLIRSTTDPKEKRRHILIYNFKVSRSQNLQLLFPLKITKTKGFGKRSPYPARNLSVDF